MKKFCLLLAAAAVFSTSSFAEIGRFKEVSQTIYRGSQPQTDADYDLLVAKGVKTLINFRQFTYPVDKEERRWQEAISRFNKAHPGANRVGYFKWHPFSAVLKPSKNDMLEILRDMTLPELLPAFVHCQEGKDRTGLAVALYQIHALHWKVDDAYREWLAMGADKKWRPMFWAFKDYSDWANLTSDGVPWVTEESQVGD